ncbi:hypothetical protein RIF29_02020 [Crotalaria pallida]|uniref:Uncharacterized protein n=1 Tax=Crotalaria pallida TaxID=3830 RepID=A0AAN9P8U3_CROPI
MEKNVKQHWVEKKKPTKEDVEKVDDALKLQRSLDDKTIPEENREEAQLAVIEALNSVTERNEGLAGSGVKTGAAVSKIGASSSDYGANTGVAVSKSGVSNQPDMGVVHDGADFGISHSDKAGAVGNEHEQPWKTVTRCRAQGRLNQQKGEAVKPNSNG